MVYACPPSPGHMLQKVPAWQKWRCRPACPCACLGAAGPPAPPPPLRSLLLWDAGVQDGEEVLQSRGALDVGRLSQLEGEVRVHELFHHAFDCVCPSPLWEGGWKRSVLTRW